MRCRRWAAVTMVVLFGSALVTIDGGEVAGATVPRASSGVDATTRAARDLLAYVPPRSGPVHRLRCLVRRPAVPASNRHVLSPPSSTARRLPVSRSSTPSSTIAPVPTGTWRPSSPSPTTPACRTSFRTARRRRPTAPRRGRRSAKAVECSASSPWKGTGARSRPARRWSRGRTSSSGSWARRGTSPTPTTCTTSSRRMPDRSRNPTVPVFQRFRPRPSCVRRGSHCSHWCPRRRRAGARS